MYNVLYSALDSAQHSYQLAGWLAADPRVLMPMRCRLAESVRFFAAVGDVAKSFCPS